MNACFVISEEQKHGIAEIFPCFPQHRHRPSAACINASKMQSRGRQCPEMSMEVCDACRSPLLRQEAIAAAAAAAASLQLHALSASKSAEQRAAMGRSVDGGVPVHAECPLLRQEAIAAAAATAGLQLHAISAREVQSRERQCAEVSMEVCECMPGAFSCARG